MPGKIRLILDQYQPISLDDIEAIKLMNRMDTKYIVPTDTLMRLLEELSDDYLVLEIDSHRFGEYQSVYYDTCDLDMFRSHVTAHYPRFKVRERRYSQNGLQFLEVKHKATNGRTSKKRLPLENETDFDTVAEHIVVPHTPFRTEELYPQLSNSFNRITLVNKVRTERLTLDFDLQFNSLDGVATPVFKQTAVVELKQDKKADSVIARRLRDENIRPCGMSKYCVGMLLLYSNLTYKMYKKNFVKFINTAQWTS